MSDTTTPLAHLADDPAVIHFLLEMYVASYTSGAFTALYNAYGDALESAPRSDAREAVAAHTAASLGAAMLADPAVMLSLEKVTVAHLRGETVPVTAVRLV